MSFASIVLWLSALPFAGIGAAFLVAPGFMAHLVGLAPADATALADIRAVYGGLQLGCAGFLVYCAMNPALYGAGLIFQMAGFGGLCFARFISYAAAGLPSTLGYVLHAGEAIGLAFGIAAWLHFAKSEAVARRSAGSHD